MTFTSDRDLGRTVEAFLHRTLPKSEWTHEAHFAVALYLLRDAEIDAERQMPNYIRAYNVATGVANTDHQGYHETITLASLRAAAYVKRRHDTNTALHTILSDLMQSDFRRSDWLLAHWSKPYLFSAQARRAWVDPDLAPLPF